MKKTKAFGKKPFQGSLETMKVFGHEETEAQKDTRRISSQTERSY